jgi:capsular polysaccharide biosynthesis protein
MAQNNGLRYWHVSDISIQREDFMAPFSQRNRIKLEKRWIKKQIISLISALPLHSKIIGAPKGYWLSSKEYFINSQHSSNKICYFKHIDATTEPSKPPHSLDSTIHRQFEQAYSYCSPETFVLTISEGRVTGTSGTIITPDDKLLFDVSLQFGVTFHPDRVRDHYVLNCLKLPKCEIVNVTIAVIASAGAEGYFHLLTDVIPRVAILRQAAPHLFEKIDKFLVSPGIPAIAGMLKRVGIPEEKILFASPSLHLQASQLVVPSLPGIAGLLPNWSCHYLREHFLPHADPNSHNIPRLYISRSRAAYRRVVNELEVIDCLSQFGFQVVFLEELELSHQIALFAHAEIIVAPHGAGLTNLIWCNPTAKVIEIFSPSYVNVCFWTIANHVGLKYCYLLGESDQPNDGEDPHLIGEDIFVNLEQLNLALTQLI